ncbi:MAG: hypothetical protein KDA45_15545, partial [Planctomycetales bacterium]|nr:hypothetical protein [Planctomycetales bacterium]
MHIAPHAANSIEQPAPLLIEKPHAFGTVDNQRLILGHLREGMPIVLAVALQQILSVDRNYAFYQWTSTGAPVRTPSSALALSPTKT